jgi:hypothetical protein
MRHVFVETNWVVDYAAPAHLQLPAAIELADKAAAGQIRLHLPAVCLTEAAQTLRNKFRPRQHADAVRKYLRWAMSQTNVSAGDGQIVRRVLDQYESAISAELDDLENRYAALAALPGVEVFALNSNMLARAVELSTKDLYLKPFDQSILAAVLVRAEELLGEREEDVAFCELDGDLQPWDKEGRTKEPLTTLYNVARVWVYGDFLMQRPNRPKEW